MLTPKELKRPPVITPAEITAKLAHLREVLGASGYRGILFQAEGALRWLTGTRHQVTDVDPAGASPVAALCLGSGKGWEITFISAPWETPRLRDEMPPVFKGVAGVKLAFANARPKVPAGTLLPCTDAYPEILGRAVRPLIGGFTGNQFKKYAWVAAMQARVVAESARQLRPGMNGPDVHALLYGNLAAHGLETNMILLALRGQQGHLHPLYGEQYKVAPNCMLKLVTAARFGDVIVSESQLVKFGRLTAKETATYAALREAAVEYADLYRAGAAERDVWAESGKRFAAVEKKYGLKGFGRSAYLHHCGGPTSPLGNRDYCIDKSSSGRCFPGMSFAVNPCDALGCGLKVEIQGVVTADGAPRMLDPGTAAAPDLLPTSEVAAAGGTVCRVQDIIVL